MSYVTDADNFSAWYEQHHARLVATLTAACGNLDLAADAADEAFVRALVRWDRVGMMSSPTGWTYRVALNIIRRRTRRLGAQRNKVDPTGVATNLDVIDVDTWRAVARLPERQRTAVVLRYVADLPEEEVARAMGVRRGTVASNLADARRNLARALGPDEDEETEK